jgi:hypothetical protein
MEFAADIVAAASRRRALNVGTIRITADQMRLLDQRLGAIRAVLDNVEVYGPLRLDEAEALAAEIAPIPT